MVMVMVLVMRTGNCDGDGDGDCLTTLWTESAMEYIAPEVAATYQQFLSRSQSQPDHKSQTHRKVKDHPHPHPHHQPMESVGVEAHNREPRDHAHHQSQHEDLPEAHRSRHRQQSNVDGTTGDDSVDDAMSSLWQDIHSGTLDSWYAVLCEYSSKCLSVTPQIEVFPGKYEFCSVIITITITITITMAICVYVY